ncbi:zinc finger, CCHC-type containing protein, partial [Tanacetum coccineum]
DFKHTLKHLKEELTLVELGSHLRIKESLRVQDNDKPKRNNVVGPSVVNMVEHNNSSRYNDNKGKRKHHDNTRVDPNKKAKPTCWKCGKTGHIKRDYKGVNDDDVAWWVDSGATVHVCKDRCWFKTYESLNDGSILHMGNESTALVHRRGCVDLRSSYARAMIEFQADVELKDTIEECPKNPGLGVAKNLKKNSRLLEKNDVGFWVPIGELQIWLVKSTILVDPRSGMWKVVGEPVKKVDYLVDHDSEDEVGSVDNDMARSMASEKARNIPDKIQAICDNLDIKVRGRKKK